MTKVLVDGIFDAGSFLLFLWATVHPYRLGPIAMAMNMSVGAFFAFWCF